MTHKLLTLLSCLVIFTCNKQSRPGFPYGYNGCKVAAEKQADYLRRGEKEKFRYMMLDRDTFTRIVFPRLRGYRGTNAEDVWNLTAFEIERSNEKAFEDFKGATSIQVNDARKIEEHDGLRLHKNLELVVTNGNDAKGVPITQKSDKVFSALVEIDGLCRHWVNAYKD